MFLDGAVCFWTSAVVARVPVLRSPKAARLLLQVLDECRVRCGVKLVGYVIMPDHIHLAVWAEDASAIKRFLRQFLGAASSRLAGLTQRAADRGEPIALLWLEQFKRQARDGDAVRVWKERGRAFPVTREDGLRQKLEYIHNNPVRAGLVAAPEDWEFSSAAWYARGEGPIALDDFDW